MTFFPTYQETIRELRPEIRNKDRGTTQPGFRKLVNTFTKLGIYILGAYPGPVQLYSSISHCCKRIATENFCPYTPSIYKICCKSGAAGRLGSTSVTVVCRYPIWVAVLYRGLLAFKAVGRHKMIIQKDECRVEVLFIPFHGSRHVEKVLTTS